jgi:membrane-associated protease RseP (regulator of RpoE activity)
MKPKALPLVAFVLLAAAAVSAQTPPPAAPAPAAPAVAPAPPASDVLPAVAAAPEAPEAPLAPLAPFPDDVPGPAVAPLSPDAPLPPQEPAPAAPPAVATTLWVSGNFLGVRTEEVTRENMQRYGLKGEPRGVGVREVVKGSPAEKAGLRADDVIVRFDGEPVTSVRKLTRLIEESAPDHAARITVARGGSEQELSATLTRREPLSVGELGPVTVYGTRGPWPLGGALVGPPEQWGQNGDELRKHLDELGREHPGLFAGTTRRIGVTTNALGKQLADYFGVTHGVLVSSVEEGSPADKAGLKAGDIVTEADGQKVEDSDDLTRALSAKQEGEVTLTVVRDRKPRAVRITPERRTAPQGLFAPGSFRVFETPVAALASPGIQMHPDVLSGPRVVVTPRLPTAPRIRVTPRARVLRPGDRVL